MADISKLKVTQNGASTEYNVKDTAARNAVAQVTQDLANYYLKSETYNKTEVDNLIAGIKQFTYVVAESLPTASASTMYKIYLIPSAHSVTSNVRDEYITIQEGSTYKFEQIGSTAADFSAYSTTEEMNAAIASALTSYYTKTNVDALLASLASDVQDDIEALAEHVSDTYAKKDGDYETLGAGSATNLKGNTVSNAKFSFRTAGGSSDIATGQAQLNKVKGNTIVWNQLFRTNYTESLQRNYTLYSQTSTFIKNHKFLVSLRYTTTSEYTIGVFILTLSQGGNTYGGEATISNVSPNQSNVLIRCILTSNNSNNNSLFLRFTTGSQTAPAGSLKATTFNVIDLTQMFGAGKEPSTVEEFEAMFPEEYYPYSAPTLLSFRADGIKTVGFNQFNYATGKAKVIPNNEYQITGTYTSLSMNGETITPDSDGIFTPTQFGDVDVVGGNATTCIHLVWSGIRNGEFEEYWESRLDHPLTQLTGKLNGEGESVVIFPDGLRSAGTVHDEIVGNKAIVRVGIVDLGTLSWPAYTYTEGSSTYPYGYTGPVSISLLKGGGNIINTKYSNKTTYFPQSKDKSIVYHNSENTIYICDTAFKGMTGTQIKAALSGVIMAYELRTPREYIIDDFQLPAGYRVDDFGTEEIYVGEGLTTPCDLDVIYGINAADTIRRLPDNYVSATEAQEFSELEKAQARRNICVLSEEEAARKDGVYKEMVVGGSLNLVDASDDSVPREFTFDTAGGVNDIGTGLAVLKRLNGNTIVWNQKWKHTVLSESGVTYDATTHTYYVDRTIFSYVAQMSAPIVGHKYYASIEAMSATDELSSLTYLITGTTRDGINVSQIPKQWTKYSKIATATNTTSPVGFTYWYGYGAKPMYCRNVMYIDLTLMFGTGNEPSTAAEFEKLFPLDYYDYNAGSLLSFNGTGLKTTGFNQWDEEWEAGGIETTGGINTTTADYNRSKNYIRVLGNTSYYIKSPVLMMLFYYDINKTYLGESLVVGKQNETFTTPANAAYMRFRNYTANTWTPYNNDICINLSWSGTKNGTYEPYEEHTLNYDISAIQDGEGNQLFPLGLLSAGSAHDELTSHKAIKRVGAVDLGTLSWSRGNNGGLWANTVFYAALQGGKNVGNPSPALPTTISPTMTYYMGLLADNTAQNNSYTQSTTYIYIKNDSYTTVADFKAAMSGVMLYYELATPIEVDFDEQLNLSYNVNDWGTEELLPENGTTPTTSPAKFDIVYNVNAVDTLKNLPRNYLAQGDLDRLLTALGTALGFTYTKTWNQETKEWAFTVTPTTQGE